MSPWHKINTIVLFVPVQFWCKCQIVKYNSWKYSPKFHFDAVRCFLLLRKKCRPLKSYQPKQWQLFPMALQNHMPVTSHGIRQCSFHTLLATAKPNGTLAFAFRTVDTCRFGMPYATLAPKPDNKTQPCNWLTTFSIQGSSSWICNFSARQWYPLKR